MSDPVPTPHHGRAAPARRVALLLAMSLGALLAACGGGGDAASEIGPAGGSIDGPAGASVTVPAGALAAPARIAVAASSDGAPALPAGHPGGDVFALTPHGTTFAAAVTVRLPVDPSRVPAGFTPRLYKTNAAGAWEVVPGATVAGGFVTAQVSGFSWFAFGALPPTITASPASVAVVEPAPAAFSVSAAGSPPFTYQWQRSSDGGTTWTDIPGATTRDFTTGPTSAATDNGLRLRAVVSNPDGPAPSAIATLTVTAPAAAPTITTQPANVAAAPGGSATFTVVANGNGLLYQWERSSDGGTTWGALPGETNASLVLANLALGDTGAQFRAVVGNGAASATSTAAVLTVTAPTPPLAASGGRVGAGNALSIVRASASGLMSWGGDGSGELGNGEPRQDQSRPVAVTLADVAVLSAAGRKGAAVDSAGRGWAWGSNSFGELGNGTLDSAAVPTANVGASPASRYQSVSVGPSHIVWLRTDGRIESAGYNGVGALGHPSLYLSQTAVELPGGRAHRLVAAGDNFTLAVRDDGSLWAWGTNNSGQFGKTPSFDHLQGSQHAVIYVPNGPIAIAAGYRHAMALDATGQVWAWGETANGKIGIGPTFGTWVPPTPVPLTGTFVAIACGQEFSLALRDDGALFAWGIDETGQLGQGRTLGMSTTPLQVPGLPPLREVAAGWGLGHVVAVARDGSVWTWGHNDAGQLGNGTRTASATPRQVLPAGSVN